MLDHEDAMRQSVTRLNNGKSYFLGEMQSMGYRVLHGYGNFLHVDFGNDREAVHAALESHVYYRKDFRETCLQGFSRFSATTSANFEPIVARIRAASAANSTST